MLYQWIRLFNSDNGVITDESLANQDESSTVTWNLTTAEDYKYIAKYAPFNNFYLKVNTANDVASVMKIEYWDGQYWREAVDILDGTSSGGVSIAKSGIVQFSPDIDFGWNRISDTTDSNSPTDLQTLHIYNNYWLRISFNDTLKATTKTDRFGYAFTTSQQLKNIDVQINSYLEAFATGKTNWENEILTSSLHVAKDLEIKGFITEEGQVLRLSDVSLATDYKTLSLIYAALGPNQDKKRDYWHSQYEKYLSGRKTLDNNSSGFVDRQEISSTMGNLVR